jgi:hypothetical protein
MGGVLGEYIVFFSADIAKMANVKAQIIVLYVHADLVIFNLSYNWTLEVPIILKWLKFNGNCPRSQKKDPKSIFAA